MRVAVLGIKALPAFAGADRVVERLLEHASPEIDYTIYLVRGPTKLACTRNRHYVYVPALRGKHLRAASYFLICCLHYLVKGGQFDVVHIHNSDFGLVSPLLRLRRRVRIVGTFHGDPYRRGKWGVSAKGLLRASEWVFVRMCDELTSVSAQKRLTGRVVRYIPNGLDERPLPAPDESAMPAVANDEYVMFACARLERTKGLHHLLRAYRGIPTDVRLLVVGDFSHDPRYTTEIERAAAADNRVVLHQGLLEPATLFALVRRCKVFVFPSEVEGMSMMLLEAVAAGALVVCSDIPENAAVVGADHPYLFRSGDAESLRRTLERALVEAGDWSPERLLSRIQATFRWDVIAAAYEGLYAPPRATERQRSASPTMS